VRPLPASVALLREPCVCLVNRLRAVTTLSTALIRGHPHEGATRVTWLGHSTVLIEVRAARLLTDPALRQRMGHLRRLLPLSNDPIRNVDAVLVSHVHWDHLDLPSLRLLGPDPLFVVPLGSGRMLRRHGFARVDEVVPGDRIEVGGVRLLVTHAEHVARRRPWGTRPPSLGFVAEDSLRTYFAGDTDLFADMAELAPLDVALLPISGWGRRTGPGHLDPERAVEALRLLRPRVAIPIHWGTYSRIAARADPAERRQPVEEFLTFAGELAPETEIRVLSPGESIDVTSRAG
jgi:L-ascorbate metabolism protein UlaG (beta-lactamase superfamily)